MNSSWIRLYRKLLTDPVWLTSTPEQKAVLIAILLMANHTESEWEWMGEKFRVNPGEFVTSLESIRVASGKGISIQNVRSAIARFEKLNFLTYKATKTGRVIKVCKWDSYQQSETATQQRDQQTGNKDLTTNKNDKNDKKKERVVFTPPTLPEIQSYFAIKIAEKQLSLNAAIEAEKFLSHYSSNGWQVGKNKMKDWKAAINGWVAREKGKLNGTPHKETTYQKLT